MRLTPEQFFALVARKPHMQERTREMAYAVLVGGYSTAEIGRRFDVSRQAAHRASMKVLKLFYEEMQVPEGWEVVQAKLPPILANQVREMEREQLELYAAVHDKSTLKVVSG